MPHLTCPSRTISTTILNPTTFAPFGQVIQNPATHDEMDGNGQWRLEHVTANQGTATKWIDVTHMENWYERAASKKPAKSVLNMFVCRPRELSEKNGLKTFFPVKVLERHPYTPQTFIPMGVSRNDPDARYLVIVAPTLPSTSSSSRKDGHRPKPYPAEKPPSKRKKSLKERLLGARPNPYTNDFGVSTTPPSTSSLPVSREPKGAGMPDLQNLQAFIARGDQAVTYGPGTWHAPMVVLGKQEIEFVVVQYANGVAVEDVQEVGIEAEGDGLFVNISEHSSSSAADTAEAEAAKPGYMRAKL